MNKLFTSLVIALTMGFAAQAKAADQVTILEFGNFECSYCAQAAATVNQLLSEYGNQLIFEFKNVPTLTHVAAKSAALTEICAKEQGHSLEMYTLLSQPQVTLESATYTSFAQTIGLDMNQFNTCLPSASATQTLTAEIHDADIFRVAGTPTFFFISGTQVIRMDGAQAIGQFRGNINYLLRH